MPRRPREDRPGAWHHVMQRGARRAPIFRTDSHYSLFLGTLESAVQKYDIEVHGYSLMPNHYHLLMRSRHGNLSGAMRRLNAGFVQKLNVIHNWDGPLFRGRFKSQAIRDETNLSYVIAYIHLNPLRANLVTRLGQESWTSHRQYLGREHPHAWLTTNYFLSLHGGGKQLHDYILRLHRGALRWPDELTLRTGWFVRQGETSEREFSSADVLQVAKPAEALKRIRTITGANSRTLRRSELGAGANPSRRFAVWALARQTLLTHEQIGATIGMTTVGVANVLRRLRINMNVPSEWVGTWKESFDK